MSTLSIEAWDVRVAQTQGFRLDDPDDGALLSPLYMITNIGTAALDRDTAC